MYLNNQINYYKLLSGKKIIIFGAGNVGEKVLRQLRKHKFNVVAFCDNDAKKKGKCIDGIKVCGNLDAFLKDVDCNTIFVVACLRGDEIKEELMNSGYLFVDYTDIDFSTSDLDYYDKDYFDVQLDICKFNSIFAAEKFQPYIKETDKVLEFGSGEGFLLKQIKAYEKAGIEINDYAREYAKKEEEILFVKYTEEVPDDYYDVIISTHVLEHVNDPLGELKQLRRKLKDNGNIVFIVPFECNDKEYFKNDYNQHLYTWNCLNLGNLFKRAGFFVKEVRSYSEQWPYENVNYDEIYKSVGRDAFLAMANMYGKYVNEKNIFIRCIK